MSYFCHSFAEKKKRKKNNYISTLKSLQLLKSRDIISCKKKKSLQEKVKFDIFSFLPTSRSVSISQTSGCTSEKNVGNS